MGGAMKPKILILTDWREYFSSKFIGDAKCHEKVNIDIEKIAEVLENNFDVVLQKYQDLDLNKNYRGWYVIYASSEERGLFYKGYIEDVLLKLQYDGAVLIPDFRYFRAHGNKSFQEMLRKQFKNPKLRNIESDIVGRLNELNTDKYTFPCVVKSASGSGSLGVRLVHNPEELFKESQKLSFVKYIDQYYTRAKDIVYSEFGWKIKIVIYKFMKRSQSYRNPGSFFHANKLVIQNYIEGLDSDYKVLYYFGKYYVLRRMNRQNDFRASGSGKFVFPSEISEIETILNYAKEVANELYTPMISMDLALGGGIPYLIEFQCLGFGPYTIQYAEWHFEFRDNHWIKVNGRDNIEVETARSIEKYIYDIQSDR